jgi:hypothetical protein
MVAAILLLAGCDPEPDSHVVSALPPPAPGTAAVTAPVVVTTQANAVTTRQAVVVTQAPPALQAEVVSEQPSPAYVWIAGYWTWNNNHYLWVAGHWQIPPQQNSVWVRPHWEPEGGAFRFYEGYWN